jgi:glycosyltransferase involved in cell wall biosynthesis
MTIETANKDKIRFSLCSIYKNEGKNLEEFISHHQPLVDEMVLVDTGSTDNSNDIVAAHGFDYHFFAWTQNFSQARNASLKLPNQPWIIVLDIDELVLEEDFIRLKEIIRTSQKDAYSLKQINFSDAMEDINWRGIGTLPPQFQNHATGYIESPLIRVFRNHQGIRFHGAIHELVGESIHKLNLTSTITDIPIYHLGWTTSARTDIEKQKKKESYRELIHQEWQRDPSPKMAFYYLSTLESPQEKLKLGFRLTKEFPQIKQFWEVVARTAAGQEQWTRALAYIQKGLQHHPMHIPLLAIKLKCLNETAQPEQALILANSLLEKDTRHPIYWFEKFRALIMLKRKDDAKVLIQHLPPQFPPQLAQELIKVLER